MNLRLLFLLATCFMLSTVHDIQAQVERNAIYKIGIGHFNYTPKGENDNAGKVLKNITSSIIKGKNTTQLSDYADDVRASIAKGFGNVVKHFKTKNFKTKIFFTQTEPLSASVLHPTVLRLKNGKG